MLSVSARKHSSSSLRSPFFQNGIVAKRMFKSGVSEPLHLNQTNFGEIKSNEEDLYLEEATRSCTDNLRTRNSKSHHRIEPYGHQYPYDRSKRLAKDQLASKQSDTASTAMNQKNYESAPNLNKKKLQEHRAGLVDVSTCTSTVVRGP
jgi:hypothetical protein